MNFKLFTFILKIFLLLFANCLGVVIALISTCFSQLGFSHKSFFWFLIKHFLRLFIFISKLELNNNLVIRTFQFRHFFISFKIRIFIFFVFHTFQIRHILFQNNFFSFILFWHQIRLRCVGKKTLKRYSISIFNSILDVIFCFDLYYYLFDWYLNSTI